MEYFLCLVGSVDSEVSQGYGKHGVEISIGIEMYIRIHQGREYKYY